LAFIPTPVPTPEEIFSLFAPPSPAISKPAVSLRALLRSHVLPRDFLNETAPLLRSPEITFSLQGNSFFLSSALAQVVFFFGPLASFL